MMRRKRLLGALLALAGVTAVLVALSGTSYADDASGSKTTSGSFVSSNNVWEAALPSNWRLGDCQMLANYRPGGASPRSLVRIVHPDSAGHANVYAFEATETFSSPTDVWWLTLTFYTSFGTPILTTPRMAGAQMRQTNTIYTVDAWAGASVRLDPQLYPLISYVKWDVSC